MVHWHERPAEREGQRFGVTHAHEERTDQTGSIGDGDRVDVRGGEGGFIQRAAHHGDDAGEVRA